jgi:hypothetical protein
MESPKEEEDGREGCEETEEDCPQSKSPSKGFLMHILDDDEIDDMSEIEEPPVDELSSLEISQTRVEMGNTRIRTHHSSHRNHISFPIFFLFCSCC